jgi:hypothetical protein
VRARYLCEARRLADMFGRVYFVAVESQLVVYVISEGVHFVIAISYLYTKVVLSLF